MMDIVMRRRELLSLQPNERWSFPDAVAQQLIDRGAAEAIPQDIIAQEGKAKKSKA